MSALVAVTKYISTFANPANNKVVIADPGMSPFSEGQVFSVSALAKKCVADLYLLREIVIVPATPANIKKHYLHP